MSSPNSLQRRQTGTVKRKGERSQSASGRNEVRNARMRLTILDVGHKVRSLGSGEEMGMAGQLSHSSDQGEDVGICEKERPSEFSCALFAFRSNEFGRLTVVEKGTSVEVVREGSLQMKEKESS